MNKIIRNIVCVLLFFVCCGLVYAIYSSIMQPVNFNKEKDYREEIAVQRLKDIRTLQVAYKGVHNRFVSTVDSLKEFYNNGEMSIIMQVGSNDDSVAVAHTEAIKKANRKITSADLLKLYQSGDKNLVFSVETKVPVRDTLFNGRNDFCIDSLKYIPFSGKQPVEMEAIIKQVSGVPVPLFEAKMPYKKLLKGLDNQLRINLDAERRNQNKYEGLQVGSISAPNNNAGNWE
ncbi:MAG: hypothetical protein KIG56_00725 [Bacteroidales bacterium]|nr:hypothetical protein [Bacteroidales bacterium]MCI5619325.1 hypothetical protein [Rikenellaceae bacterium]